MEKKLRRYEDYVIVSAKGIMLFGIWNILKSVLYATVGRSYLFKKLDIVNQIKESAGLDQVQEIGLVNLEYMYLAVLFIFLFTYTVVGLFLRFYLYRTAIAEVKGRKKSWFYVILASFILALSIFNFISMFSPNSGIVRDADFYVSLIADFTGILALLQFVVSTILVKKYRKDMMVE